MIGLDEELRRLTSSSGDEAPPPDLVIVTPVDVRCVGDAHVPSGWALLAAGASSAEL
jgi:hypothetical protein